MMKKYLYMLFVLLFGCIQLDAQNDCAIPLMVYVPKQPSMLPLSAQASLTTKIRQLVTQSGLESGAGFSTFCIVANITEESKNVISGLRPLVTLTINLNLFVGNNYTSDKYSSAVVTLSGAGQTEAKAYMSAFSGINFTNTALQTFIKDAKKKILAYYETQIPNIIKQANSFALRREYEEALCLLASVPICSSKYGDVEKCMLSVFQDYVDYDCAQKVAKARAVWDAGQNKESASVAGAYLTAIDPSSTCWSDAIALSNSIRSRIGDDWEFSKELQRDAVKLEKTRIDAVRAIGVAYGNNQKANTISEHWIVR